ncbi:MAG: translation elongation factor Ts [Planctomycetota bacterium]
MSEISAGVVMKLRKMSGQGMMDCKKALQEANGDIEEAMVILRKKGLATLEKRAGRETSEGKVICTISKDGKAVAMATLCCETDFVANSNDFSAAADLLQGFLLGCPEDQGVENVLDTVVNGRKFSDVLTEAVSKTGEKIELADYERIQLDGAGLFGTYVHFNGKIGAVVQIATSDAEMTKSEELKQLASDIAMHVTALKPLAINKDQIAADIIEREKAIAAEQVRNKPANIVDKIVEGKMRKFFAENCLVDQPFVKDDNKTVAQMVKETTDKLGGKAEIKKIIRFEIG